MHSYLRLCSLSLLQYAPQLVLISAGFDAAMGDPLGGQSITPTGYAHLTYKLRSLAEGKVVLVLEGGYKYDSIVCFVIGGACPAKHFTAECLHVQEGPTLPAACRMRGT